MSSTCFLHSDLLRLANAFPFLGNRPAIRALEAPQFRLRLRLALVTAHEIEMIPGPATVSTESSNIEAPRGLLNNAMSFAMVFAS